MPSECKLGRTYSWNSAKVFADDTGRSAFSQHHPQIFFAFAAICFGIFRFFIVAWHEMRPLSAGFRQHRIPIERQKFFVLGWSPRKGVDPIKPEHMINAEDVKNSFHAAHALSPPGKIARSQRGQL